MCCERSVDSSSQLASSAESFRAQKSKGSKGKATTTLNLKGIESPLPNGLGSDTKIPCPRWYSVWLAERFNPLPTKCFDIFHTDHDVCNQSAHWKVFSTAFAPVAECVISSNSVTIDEIVACLYDKGILEEDVPRRIFARISTINPLFRFQCARLADYAVQTSAPTINSQKELLIW